MKLVAIGATTQSVKKWNPKTEAPDDEFVYIDIASVSQERKQVNGVSRLLGSDAPSRARQLVRAGDVVVSTVRPNLNAVAYIPEQLDGATASTGFSVLRTDPNQLDPRYLYHWVRSQEFVSNMVKQATGQSYPAVSDKIVKHSEIPLPPLDEQKRIAEILDQADALRRLRQRAVSTLEKVKTAVFHQMFSQSADTQPLGNIIKVGSGNGLTAKNMRGGDVPVYGGNGINGWHDEAFVDPQTVIIGRVGVYCGAVHITEKKAWVTDNALIVKKLIDIETDYLAEALRAANLNQYAGRSAQPLVSGSRIYPVEIPLPPIEDQRQFTERTAAIAGPQTALKKSLEAIELLFSSIQHRAFRGEL